MSFCLDTDVIIDCLRGKPETIEWLTNNNTSKFYIPAVVAMELIVGSQNKSDQTRIRRFINQFEIIWHTEADTKLAFNLLLTHKLSNGLSIPDCLIAATAIQRDFTLYTFNLKHFRIIANLDAKSPY